MSVFASGMSEKSSPGFSSRLGPRTFVIYATVSTATFGWRSFGIS